MSPDCPSPGTGETVRRRRRSEKERRVERRRQRRRRRRPEQRSCVLGRQVEVGRAQQQPRTL